ncbi:MAG TPA: hypothetical protein K8V15_11305 [Tessaracoccus flavescens]|uniref:Uncharacterized protein n=1 Tax=Tessaracoccus flavescens TaxID=399497 RepID=A0A921ESB3_9ACTN|nr:hypothetical protein [Tessaracoccus flavescens]
MTRTIRYFHDYGHPWPLWESFTEHYTLAPDDLGLSEQLVDLLEAAHAEWERLADANLNGETPDESALRAADRQAFAVLRRELADVADVRFEG